MKIAFFGTGTSHGIPVIGCTCAVCTSTDPRNRRNRTGVWLSEPQGPSVLLDVSCEFRVSALRHGLSSLDAVLLTHAHSDHISGLDDLRIFSQRSGRAVPLHANAATLEEVKRRFDYAFAPPKEYGGGAPQYELREAAAPFRLGPWRVTPLPVEHGPDTILGYRVDNFAFVTDVSRIPDATLGLMQGLDVLALDCLWKKPHSTHLSLSQAMEYATRIGARRTYFIHLAHDLEHEETQALLPAGQFVAWDGLELESPGK